MVGFSDIERAVRETLAGRGHRPGRGVSSGRNDPDDYRHGWDGGVSLRASADYLTRGWDAGVTDALEGLNVNAPDVSPSGGYDLDVAGEFVFVPAYCSGSPESMMRKEAGEAPRRVRLIINPWMVCSTSDATAMAYAKATCAYASGLIQAGYDVAVTGLYAALVEDGNAVGVLPISVKEFAQEPDASRLAFATHPAFMRRAIWAYIENTDEVHADLGRSGYGTLMHDPLSEAEVKACLPDHGDERMVVLPPLQRSSFTDYADWLRLFQAISFETHDTDGSDPSEE